MSSVAVAIQDKDLALNHHYELNALNGIGGDQVVADGERLQQQLIIAYNGSYCQIVVTFSKLPN